MATKIQFGKVNIVNLTPHIVSIMLDDDSRIDIPASSEVEELPEYRVDTIYIVSTLVANTVPYREDVFIPKAVRDEQGRIIGCKLGHV